ncbi:hypothetical protein [Enterovirga rhinocerotis]|uniref:Uncharacterized protein n=1 Tax=Enterovirga rhinocerotis TaxID=1339210 RepID=A0A4V3DZ06_9HYPH|nr:hypothetical protein [Enterovirga rhinocerotis]TDR94709.1 hypothetical protein EV668_1997 [Enterovirga rhinocerotis]
MIALELLFDRFGYHTGRRRLPLLSLGRIRSAGLDSPAAEFNRGFARRTDTGTVLVSSAGTAWLGILVWISVLVAALAFAR